MNQREALRILGLQPGEKPETIRHRYHQLLHRYHPDSAGEDDEESLDRSRSVIEAFRFLKREGAQAGGQAGKAWGVRENAQAFCSRKIYMEDELFGDPIILETGAAGRYYWDPELETFSMFLRSIGEAVRDLMDGIGDRFGPEADEPPDEISLRYRTRLLHLLIQEFIDPYECLGQMYPYICQIPRQEGAYEVRCHIMAEEKLLRRLEQCGITDGAWTICATDNQLLAVSDNGQKGRITFEETSLYYVVIPLFLQGAVTACLKISEKDSTRGSGRGKQPYLKARLLLTVDKKKRQDLTGKISREIMNTLEKYSQCFA